PAKGGPSEYCTRTSNGSRPCRFLLNGGVNYTDLSVSLLPMPIPEVEEGTNREPIGDYQMWDPSGLSWLDIEGVVQGLRACRSTRIYNFSIDSSEAPTASPVTGISFQGILQTSGMVDFLQGTRRCEVWHSLDKRIREAHVPKWGATQGTAFAVLDQVHNTSIAANAVNCTNAPVQATAQYIVRTYGSFNVQETTSVRIKSKNNWILINTRMIDDGRGLQILLVVILPESDYLSTITKTTISAIGVCVGVSEAVLLVGITISYLVALLLRTLAGSMHQAVSFDFSPLQTDCMRDRSIVLEISDLEFAFGSILKMFADAIQSHAIPPPPPCHSANQLYARTPAGEPTSLAINWIPQLSGPLPIERIAERGSGCAGGQRLLAALDLAVRKGGGGAEYM
ncbi:hypothetical protein BDK51DRAFT_28215, partial [Blyttiomyces helicus]